MTPPNYSEIERLLVEARQGHRGSASALTELYRNYLYLIARVQIDRHLQRRISPSDVVQESILKAWRNFNQFRGQTEAELVAWLRSIVVNEIKTGVEREIKAGKRSLWRETSLQDELGRVDESANQFDLALVSQASSPSERAGKHELAALVADRIARLPPSYRDVIIMRNLEGIAFDQIAERLGKTSGAVRAIWVRALAKLQGDTNPTEQL